MDRIAHIVTRLVIDPETSGFYANTQYLVDVVGFEPTKAEPAGLQSAHVDRLYTHPKTLL
jgi:hypothetical protein